MKPLSSRGASLLDEQIWALCAQGQLDQALDLVFQSDHKGHASLHQESYISLLRACHSKRALSQAKRLHAHLLPIHGLTLNSSKLGEYLVLTLAKCGAVQEAVQVFHTLTCRTVYSWTALIAAFAECGQGLEALRMCACMQKEGIEPNKYTFVSFFKACSSPAFLDWGRRLHTHVCRNGLEIDIFITSILVSMYGKCGAFTEAENVFSASLKRDVVLWNAMLSAYVEHKQGEKILLLYRQMRKEGIDPDHNTFLMALHACNTLAKKGEYYAEQGACMNTVSLEIGRALHADAQKKGYNSKILLGTALLTMYAKCGSIQEAEHAFGALNERDVASWNAMLSAYVEQSQGQKALHLYKYMLRHNLILDDATLTCVLQACSDTGSVVAKEIHFVLVSASLEMNLILAVALIHAYGSCASLVDAQAVLEWLSNPDIVSWTACLAGYAREGQCIAGLKLFAQLLQEGINPDGVMFGSLLSACSLSGHVVEGLNYVKLMGKEYTLTPNLNHYNLMIDLLGRAGDFKRVESMLKRISNQADLSLWLSLLGLCSIHGNLELGKLAFDNALKLHPQESLTYVLMSNICRIRV